LALADVVVLTDIYPAGEAPIAGVTLDALAAQVRRHVKELVVVPQVTDVPGHVAMLAQDGDLIVAAPGVARPAGRSALLPPRSRNARGREVGQGD
jgi:UDP-N-acetylmuramate-alanine ligase